MLIAAMLVIVPAAQVVAGIDQPWIDSDHDNHIDLGSAIVLFAIVAVVIHLIEKGAVLSSLIDLAKGLSLLATMYLTVFLFFACLLVVVGVLNRLGLGSLMSLLIGCPLGLFIAWKLFGAYQDWRHPTPPVPSRAEYESRCASLMDSADWTGMCAASDNWIHDHPTDALAWFSSGYAYEQEGDVATASAAYRKALEYNPGLLQAAKRLAYLLAK